MLLRRGDMVVAITESVISIPIITTGYVTQVYEKKYNKSYLPFFFQRFTRSGGPGGSGISSNSHSLNVIAGKPSADFPVCLRVEAIVAGDLGGDG